MKKYLALITFAIFPAISFAQDMDFDEVGSFFANLTALINGTLVPLAFAAAFILFLYGVLRFFFLNADGREDGKKYMLWGIVAFFVMLSVFALVRILQGALGLDEGAADLEDIPGITTTNSDGRAGSAGGG